MERATTNNINNIHYSDDNNDDSFNNQDNDDEHQLYANQYLLDEEDQEEDDQQSQRIYNNNDNQQYADVDEEDGEGNQEEGEHNYGQEQEDEEEEIISQNSILQASNNHYQKQQQHQQQMQMNHDEDEEDFIYGEQQHLQDQSSYQHINQSSMLDAQHLIMNLQQQQQQPLDYYQNEFQRHQQLNNVNQQDEDEEDEEDNELSFNNNNNQGSDYRNLSNIQKPLEQVDEDEDDEEEVDIDSNQQNILGQYTQHQHQDDQDDEDDDEDDEDEDQILGGEMQAKFDRILGTFNDQQRIQQLQQQNRQQPPMFFQQAATPTENSGKMQKLEHTLGQSEKREGITDFKNKNMQNNMKGILNRNKNKVEMDEEQQEGLKNDQDNQVESPAVIEGVEENDQSLNIMINKRKMFANKPPMIPSTKNEEVRQPTPERGTQIIPGDYYQKTNNATSNRSNSYRHIPSSTNNNNLDRSKSRPKSASRPNQQQQQKSLPLRGFQQRPQTAKQTVQQQQQQQMFTFNGPAASTVRNDENRNVLNQQQQMPLRKPAFVVNNNKQQITPNQLRRPQTAKPLPTTSLAQAVGNSLLKPQTPAINQTPMVTSKKLNNGTQKAQKKADPVARYQNMQNQWQKSRFLKASDNSKQGRKLELDRFHKWSSLVHAHNQQVTAAKKGQGVHKFISSNAKAPTEDRRDDLRFQLRAKISQKDYVDKQMKAFHYNQEIAQTSNQSKGQFYHQQNNGAAQSFITNGLVNAQSMIDNIGGAAGEDKLEALKKQIDHLKRCIQ